MCVFVYVLIHALYICIYEHTLFSPMPCITSFLSSLRLHGGFIPPKRVPYYILPQGSVFYGTQAKTEEKKEGLH